MQEVRSCGPWSQAKKSQLRDGALGLLERQWVWSSSSGARVDLPKAKSLALKGPFSRKVEGRSACRSLRGSSRTFLDRGSSAAGRGWP